MIWWPYHFVFPKKDPSFVAAFLAERFMIDTELYEAKTLYPFQESTVKSILKELFDNGKNFNLLFQLPTGGGKTVIFSEIARRYIEKTNENS